MTAIAAHEPMLMMLGIPTWDPGDTGFPVER